MFKNITVNEDLPHTSVIGTIEEARRLNLSIRFVHTEGFLMTADNGLSYDVSALIKGYASMLDLSVYETQWNAVHVNLALPVVKVNESLEDAIVTNDVVILTGFPNTIDAVEIMEHISVTRSFNGKPLKKNAVIIVTSAR